MPLFTDICGYTTISEVIGPEATANMLGRLFTAFDSISDRHGLYKVDTIGDAARTLNPWDDPLGSRPPAFQE